MDAKGKCNEREVSVVSNPLNLILTKTSKKYKALRSLRYSENMATPLRTRKVTQWTQRQRDGRKGKMQRTRGFSREQPSYQLGYISFIQRNQDMS
jgi:hypothetical protein